MPQEYLIRKLFGEAIANEFGESVDPLHKSSLLALGLVLFVLTFVVLAFAKWMLMRLQKREGN